MYSGRLRQERDQLIEIKRQKRCRERQRTEGDRVREKEFELTHFLLFEIYDKYEFTSKSIMT